MIPMRRIQWPVLVSIAFAIAVGVTSVAADGLLPALPYHYLHPPAALSGSNTPPSGSVLTVSATYLRTVVHLSLFTKDGQAGTSASKGTFLPAPRVQAAVFRIQPVDPPPGLPSGDVLDGNAYDIAVSTKPVGTSMRIARPFNVILRWPYIPTGIDVYRNRKWRQICDVSRAILTGSTISCKVSSLGIVAPVTYPHTTGLPVTPVSSTPAAWINRYIPLAAALAIILLAAVGGFFVTRPDKPKKPSA